MKFGGKSTSVCGVGMSQVRNEKLRADERLPWLVKFLRNSPKRVAEVISKFSCRSFSGGGERTRFGVEILQGLL